MVPVRLADRPLLACANRSASGAQHLLRTVAVGEMVFHGRLSCHLSPTPLCLTKSGSGVSGVH